MMRRFGAPCLCEYALYFLSHLRKMQYGLDIIFGDKAVRFPSMVRTAPNRTTPVCYFGCKPPPRAIKSRARKKVQMVAYKWIYVTNGAGR